MKLAIVEVWHHAVNARDVERVVALTSADVEIVGPRGSARGHDVLRQWTVAAGASFDPVRWFCGADGGGVVEQLATWPSEEERTDPLGVATSFTVSDGRITRIARQSDLGSALLDGGLTLDDQVSSNR